MLSLKHVILPKTNNHRSLLSSIFSTLSSNNNNSNDNPLPSPSSSYYYGSVSASAVAESFKTWFNTSNRDPLLHHIHQILSSSQNRDEFSSALSSLPLPPLSEPFVLRVLRHLSSNRRNVLSSLKFFDWAGNQPNFHHTRNTFTAIFRILSNAKLTPLILDFLHNFRTRRYLLRGVRFSDTLVIGYAIAGKPEIALYVFARMRFQGLDLDAHCYNVLLNALAEQNCFNAFEVISKQIRMRGFENHVTHVIVIKSLCKQGRLDEAEGYLNALVASGKELDGAEVSFLVDALCQGNRFHKASRMVRQFAEAGLVPLENAYGVWIKGLVRGGKLNEALKFFWQKKDEEEYVPGLVWYNLLICRFLRKNKLREAYDLMMDMSQTSIPPDMITMNAVLCFFCKAGMVDVAFELYDSRSEFGLSPSYMAYKYLILTLCWDGCTKEAYSVLKSAVSQGYFPDRRIYNTLASALCRERKIDEMKELLELALARNFTPHSSTYDNFISALCQAGRVEDGYLINGETNHVTARISYSKMIKGFNKSKRGDMAARLLVEMKVNGHKLTRALCRPVLCSVLEMDNPKAHFFYLLEMLSRHETHCEIYNCFIDAAGHAKNPEVAREVYELMIRNGIKPTMSSHVLILESYLKSDRIPDALNFFNYLRCQGRVTKTLYNALIYGLCKCKKPDIALESLSEMIQAEFNPSIQCYELLVQQLCSSGRYHEAINVVNVYEKMGRRLTSFIGNVLLYHSLISSEVYNICVQLRGVEEGGFSGSSLLSLILGAFSGRLRVIHCVEDLEELIAKCFPLTIYTYNLLLRKVSDSDMDQACELVDRMCKMGYKPNWWTYNIMVNGFSKQGRKDKAKRWVEEMYRKGFYPTERTRSRMSI